MKTLKYRTVAIMLSAPWAAAMVHASGPQVPQNTAQPAASAVQTSPSEQERFAQARTAFGQGRWTEAAGILEALHTDVPSNPVYAKFAAEAELNAGRPEAAEKLVQSVLNSNPEDAQALAILAHLYAQAKNTAGLDSILVKLQTLHDAHKTEIARIPLGDEALPGGGHAQLLYFLSPLKPYNIYNMARVVDANNKLVEQITLESGDFDQPAFAREHPEEAAKGARRFSIDGYVNMPDGTQTHYTYAFLDGRPALSTFREKVVAIASGTLKPISSRSGLPVPK